MLSWKTYYNTHTHTQFKVVRFLCILLELKIVHRFFFSCFSFVILLLIPREATRFRIQLPLSSPGITINVIIIIMSLAVVKSETYSPSIQVNKESTFHMEMGESLRDGSQEQNLFPTGESKDALCP